MQCTWCIPVICHKQVDRFEVIDKDKQSLLEFEKYNGGNCFCCMGTLFYGVNLKVKNGGSLAKVEAYMRNYGETEEHIPSSKLKILKT